MTERLRATADSTDAGESFVAMRNGEGSLSDHTQNGSGSRTRTYDPRINSPLLYQLSYAGTRWRSRREGQRKIAKPFCAVKTGNPAFNRVPRWCIS